jgi:hypothetical protein
MVLPFSRTPQNKFIWFSLRSKSISKEVSFAHAYSGGVFVICESALQCPMLLAHKINLLLRMKSVLSLTKHITSPAPFTAYSNE